jgi:hypothetical protein
MKKGLWLGISGSVLAGIIGFYSINYSNNNGNAIAGETVVKEQSESVQPGQKESKQEANKPALKEGIEKELTSAKNENTPAKDKDDVVFIDDLVLEINNRISAEISGNVQSGRSKRELEMQKKLLSIYDSEISAYKTAAEEISKPEVYIKNKIIAVRKAIGMPARAAREDISFFDNLLKIKEKGLKLIGGNADPNYKQEFDNNQKRYNRLVYGMRAADKELAKLNMEYMKKASDNDCDLYQARQELIIGSLSVIKKFKEIR